jgi:hypothetical protein
LSVNKTKGSTLFFATDNPTGFFFTSQPYNHLFIEIRVIGIRHVASRIAENPRFPNMVIEAVVGMAMNPKAWAVFMYQIFHI